MNPNSFFVFLGRALQICAWAGCGAATTFGFGAFAPPAEFLAPGDPATRAKKLPALRSGQTVFASMKRSHG
jgi:hypothetical protein